MNFKEKLNITGHLQIVKSYLDDRSDEVVFDDSNIIVSGMGAGLSYFFGGSGSLDIRDYQIDRFQIGTSGPPTGGTVSSVFDLSSPLTSIVDYGGAASNLFFSINNQIKGATLVAADGPFAMIPFHHVTKVDDTSVRYTIILDKDAANGNTLNEIGLFMKNPTSQAVDASILVAYRDFTGIPKTDDFVLIFKWTINF